ncbi:hypothetical protein RRG08_023612 [Elysia crispata]|uniref:Secreted protein n=1 Tax=Elysia crispata TaxID=231223 RepID=A0AAE0XSI0_9GAST|nr:hypothetical protein RRG08_023612 [Elysia crispata]
MFQRTPVLAVAYLHTSKIFSLSFRLFLCISLADSAPVHTARVALSSLKPGGRGRIICHCSDNAVNTLRALHPSRLAVPLEFWKWFRLPRLFTQLVSPHCSQPRPFYQSGFVASASKPISVLLGGTDHPLRPAAARARSLPLCAGLVIPEDQKSSCSVSEVRRRECEIPRTSRRSRVASDISSTSSY